MTVMRAVVKYPRGASDAEKIRELRDGLQFVAMELVELGCSVDQVETWLDEAGMSAQDEDDSRAGNGHSASNVERDVVAIRLRLDYPNRGHADYLAALDALDRLARLAHEAASSQQDAT